MDILQVGVELAPVAKVGGLGDVLLGLSRELLRKGHSVRVILPKYDCLQTELIAHLHLTKILPTWWEGKEEEMEVWTGEVENLPACFLRSRHPARYFDRETIYGCADDVKRFLHFSQMVYDYLRQTNSMPDILHIHDWQVAPLVLLLQNPKDENPKLCFTIHNLAYQGSYTPEVLESIGLVSRDYDLNDPTVHGNINFMKGGILYSHFLNTVSPSYAKEILTPEGGKGLDETLRRCQNKFIGILNGIDDHFWNPETDRYLYPRFSYRQLPLYQGDEALLSNKRVLKNLLRQRLKLRQNNQQPLVASITRLVPQKGTELIKHAIFQTLKQGGQFVLLGTTTIPSIFEDFYRLQQEFMEHPDVAIILHSPEDLVHLIYAGADLFVVPSLFEPCGLTQLISLRYGTIPIVRETGGLRDTVFDLHRQEYPREKRNGFTFQDPTPSAFEQAIKRAFYAWSNQTEWEQLIAHVMKMDYSWKRSCEEYLDVYSNLLFKKTKIA